MVASTFDDDVVVQSTDRPLCLQDYKQAVEWPRAYRAKLYAKVGHQFTEMEGRSAIVNGNGHVLNPLVTDRRPIIQYHHMDDAVEAMLGTGLATGVVSAGTFNHGARAYVTLEFADPIDVPGYSRVNRWFNLTDAHDGKAAITGRSAMMVVRCMNIWGTSVLGVPSAWSIRHTTNAEFYTAQAVAAFIGSAMQQRDIEKAVERLINESYVEAEFMALVRRLIPMPKGPQAVPEAMRRRQGLTERYHNSDLDGGIRATKWGALMAVQGFEQHVLKPRKGGEKAREARHLDRVAFGALPMTSKAGKVLVRN